MSTLPPISPLLFRSPRPHISLRDFVALGSDPLSMQEAFEYVLQSFRIWGRPATDAEGFETFITLPSPVKKIVRYSPIALLLLAALRGASKVEQEAIAGVVKIHSRTTPLRFFQETQYVFSPALPLPLNFYTDLESVHGEWALSNRLAEVSSLFGIRTRRVRRQSWEVEMKHLARKWGLRYESSEEPLGWAARFEDFMNEASHWLSKTFGI